MTQPRRSHARQSRGPLGATRAQQPDKDGGAARFFSADGICKLRDGMLHVPERESSYSRCQSSPASNRFVLRVRAAKNKE